MSSPSNINLNTVEINGVKYVKESEIPLPYTRNEKSGPWQLGQPYLIRTVTMIVHGILVDVTEHELVLQKAAWIADTGRFSDFVCGKIDANEIEPFPQDQPVIVGRGGLIDAVIRPGKFDKQK